MGLMEDHIKAMNYDSPEFIPISMWLTPATWAKYGDALQRVVERHPVLFGEHQERVGNRAEVSGTYVAGTHVDNWGCVWTNVAQGLEAIVTHHPLPTRES
ncbi:MAG TPA: hypothetical protein VHV83_02585, partial [Armatimonadota bacterium]|nr:hypothetical protein [Armatimonadota bacterium]